MSDELDSLPDAHLSETFAVEVAGAKPKTTVLGSRTYTRPDCAKRAQKGQQ